MSESDEMASVVDSEAVRKVIQTKWTRLGPFNGMLVNLSLTPAMKTKTKMKKTKMIFTNPSAILPDG